MAVSLGTGVQIRMWWGGCRGATLSDEHFQLVFMFSPFPHSCPLSPLFTPGMSHFLLCSNFLHMNFRFGFFSFHFNLSILLHSFFRSFWLSLMFIVPLQFVLFDIISFYLFNFLDVFLHLGKEDSCILLWPFCSSKLTASFANRVTLKLSCFIIF